MRSAELIGQGGDNIEKVGLESLLLTFKLSAKVQAGGVGHHSGNVQIHKPRRLRQDFVPAGWQIVRFASEKIAELYTWCTPGRVWDR